MVAWKSPGASERIAKIISRRRTKTNRKLRWKRKKVPLSKRVQVRARHARFVSKIVAREKKVEATEALFRLYEKAMQRLEKDPGAMELFRQRELANIEMEIDSIKGKIAKAEQNAQKTLKNKNNEAASAFWREVDRLERQLRFRNGEKAELTALFAELKRA